MAQEVELSDYANIHELQGTKTNHGGTERPGATPGKRGHLRVMILALGVLCIVQATLNISLRLAFFSKGDTDQFPFNGYTIADMCHREQSQQNSTQFCFCYKNLLRRLLREYQALERERDNLRDMVIQLSPDEDYFLDFGSGTHEEFSEYSFN